MKVVIALSIGLAACSGSSAAPDADGGGGDAPELDAPELDAPELDAGPAPIVAPADQWTWIDFPDSRCASGTPTGIGVNIHPGAKDVLIFFEGGGACTSGASCWGPDPAAASLDGYDAAKFAATPQRNFPIFSRAGALDNPFADVNYVFVPYCTGDLHAGARDVDLTYDTTTTHTYFWGAKDLALFLPRLVATFPDAQRVWLAGGSAGGYGTVLSFDRVATAFGTRVDIIDDSGPSITPKGATQNGALAFWGYEPPPTCASPCTSHAKVLAAARARQPDSKLAFLSYASDPVISADNGYTLDEYPVVLDDFVASFADDPNAHAFIVTGEERHVVQAELLLAPQYLPWLSAMVADAPGWANVTYAHP
jgi:hypothetical protein